jgi:predicted transcriptional regulator
MASVHPVLKPHHSLSPYSYTVARIHYFMDKLMRRLISVNGIFIWQPYATYIKSYNLKEIFYG